MTNEIRQVLLTGGYGNRHVGDDAILDCVLETLRASAPGTDVIALSPVPTQTAKRHRVRTAPSLELLLCRPPVLPRQMGPAGQIRRFTTLVARFAILLWNASRLRSGKPTHFLSAEGEAFLRTLASADLVLAVGGGYLNSLWRYEQLYSKCCTFLLARALGAPVVLSGQGIGPLEHWFDRWVVAQALSRVDAIVLRDSGASAGLLRRLGVRAALLEESVDDALKMPAADASAVRVCLGERGVHPTRPTVAVSLHPSAGLERAHAAIAEGLDELVRRTDCSVLMLPMCFTHPDDDRDVLRAIRGLMHHHDRVVLFEQEMPDSLLVGMVARSSLAIASRYHMAVFALANEVPCLGLYTATYYRDKLQGLFRQFEQQQWTLDPVAEVAALPRRVLDLWHAGPLVHEQLSRRAPVLRSLEAAWVRYVPRSTGVSLPAPST